MLAFDNTLIIFLLYFMLLQMAFELYGMLAGNVSPMTGENVKPAYGGEEDAFLRKVVTPIYEVIQMVWLKFRSFPSAYNIIFAC